MRGNDGRTWYQRGNERQELVKLCESWHDIWLTLSVRWKNLWRVLSKGMTFKNVTHMNVIHNLNGFVWWQLGNKLWGPRMKVGRQSWSYCGIVGERCWWRALRWLWSEMVRFWVWFEGVFSSFGYINVKEVLLGHLVTLVLIFWGTTILFSIIAALFYIPFCCVQGFKFLHSLVNTCYFLKKIFFYSSHPNGWYHCGFDLHFSNV